MLNWINSCSNTPTAVGEATVSQLVMYMAKIWKRQVNVSYGGVIFFFYNTRTYS